MSSTSEIWRDPVLPHWYEPELFTNLSLMSSPMSRQRSPDEWIDQRPFKFLSPASSCWLACWSFHHFINSFYLPLCHFDPFTLPDWMNHQKCPLSDHLFPLDLPTMRMQPRYSRIYLSSLNRLDHSTILIITLMASIIFIHATWIKLQLHVTQRQSILE